MLERPTQLKNVTSNSRVQVSGAVIKQTDMVYMDAAGGSKRL